MLADVRQGDVGHGQVQVRDPRHDDQGGENEPGALGSGRGVVGRACGRTGCSGCGGFAHAGTSLGVTLSPRIARLG